VLVPQDVCVASRVRVGAGYARVLERDNSGVDVDWRNSPVETAGTKRLVIAGKVGIGELQVVHDAWQFGQHIHDEKFGSFGAPIDPGSTSSDDPACQAAA
jgi:hypothetical protein